MSKLIWRMVLTADDRFDLTDPTACLRGKMAEEWFNAPNFALLSSHPASTPATYWRRSVMVFRLVAAHLHGVKTRPVEGMGLDEAIRHYHWHLDRHPARFAFANFPDGRRFLSREHTRFLSAKRWQRYKVAWSSPPASWPAGTHWKAIGVDAKDEDCRTIINKFWVRCFMSLAIPGTGVCMKCGAGVPDLPSGKPTRSEICRPCRNHRYYSHHSAHNRDQLREQWAASKRRLRGTTNGKKPSGP